ncbi:MAG TPA: outer membrane protein [Pseudolabrys sp.]|nr:outer membrane protein [Pseudolabrys sp.]
MNSKLIRSGFTCMALLLAPLAAQAADLPPAYKAPPYVAPSYSNWNGFYVGINGGYGWGSSKWDFPSVNTKPSGALVGGTLGYNFQTGTWVWGIEGDWDYSSEKGSVSCVGGTATCTTKNDWLATARARLGYAGWNNWLPYITGGAAYGDIKATNTAASSAHKGELGWTLGGGVEYAMWQNWTVKLEYLYVDLGKFTCGTACGGTPSDHVNFTTNIVRAGINYRF